MTGFLSAARTVAVVAAVATAAIFVLWARHMIKRHGALVLLARWHIGEPLDGQRRTNATRTRRATKALHVTGHAHPWHWMPANYRAGIRIGAELATGLVVYGLARARTVTLVALLAAVLAMVALGVLQVMYKIRYWRHERDYLQPLELTLTHLVGIAPASVEIERDGDAVTAVALEWPAETQIDAGMQQGVLTAVTTRLAIEAPVEAWQLTGRNRTAAFTQSEPPPPKAGWADVAAAVAATSLDEVVLGLGKQRAVIKASLASDSPHVGFNMGSGGGKTNLGSFCALQFLHRGDVCCVIDAKLISYPWARDLPNVYYAGTIREIHDFLVWAGNELRRRNEVSLAGLQLSGAIYADVGPRILIFAEELNYVIPQLKRYWADLRQLDKALPKRSPALDAIADIAFAGRQVLMHLFFIGQMLTAAATGGNDSSIRGNIGISCMARYTPQSWKTMSALPMPPVPTVQGRIQVVTAAGIRETQVPYLHLDDKDEQVATAAATWARGYAVSGKLTRIVQLPGMADLLGVPDVPGQQLVPYVPPDLPLSPGTPPVVPPRPPGTVTLSEAVTAGLFKSLAAARKERQRHRDDWPDPVDRDGAADLFAITDLHEYVARKAAVR